jgi:hypothetical protein
MAEHTVRVCDFAESTCRNYATSYRLWADGERQAWSVDLCEEHAAPLMALVEGAQRVDLPSKPRVKMERTVLKTTAATRPLKR